MSKKRDLPIGFTAVSMAPTCQSPEPWMNSEVRLYTPKGNWSVKREAKFAAALSKHLQTKKDAYGKANNNNKGLYSQRSADARNLTRLAWVLEKLNPKRVCVAVLVAKGLIYIYANVVDTAGIHSHMQALVAALDDPDGRKRKALIDLIAQCLQGELRIRTKHKTTARYWLKFKQRKKRARRRLEKALRTVRFLTENNKGSRWWTVHRPKTKHKHAEMRAADAAIAGSRGFIGLSKLCCGKCFVALLSAREIGLDFDVQGAHFKTYDSSTGWPVPNFLVKNKGAMNAFLGRKAYAIYKKFPTQCLALIKKEKFEAEAFSSTDMASSEEEVDTTV